MRFADPIAQAEIDRLEADVQWWKDRDECEHANWQAVVDRLEAKAERLSSLVATYELDQQEDERIIAELRAKVAAAWDEGCAAGLEIGESGYVAGTWQRLVRHVNPYRTEAKP